MGTPASRTMTDSSLSTSRKRIVIIGAGSAGLVNLKTLRESKPFQRREWDLIVFEQREALGGIWLPELSPHAGSTPRTPLYNSLHTNLPHPTMAFRDFLFPPSTVLYPEHPVVLQYLKDYAKHFDLEQHIQFNTTVVDTERKDGKWIIHTERTNADGSKERNVLTDVDSLLVSNGRCLHPFLPSISGIETWVSKSKAYHSISYREPSPYANKRVIVVGNGPTAVDLAPEIATVASKVYQSVRGPRTGNKSIEEISRLKGKKGVELCAEIESFGEVEEGRIKLKDGTVIEGIDCVVLATGYRIYCPFLKPPVMQKGYPPTLNDDGTGEEESEYFLYNSGLWSLFFFGLPRYIVPFPLTEAQAILASSILSNSVTIDMDAEIREVKKREKLLMEIFGGDIKEVAFLWHLLESDDAQFDYREELITLAGLRERVEEQVPEWQRRVYKKKKELRGAWNDVVKRGEGEEICKGIESEEEWVKLMDRLIQRGESRTMESVVKRTDDQV